MGTVKNSDVKIDDTLLEQSEFVKQLLSSNKQYKDAKINNSNGHMHTFSIGKEDELKVIVTGPDSAKVYEYKNGVRVGIPKDLKSSSTKCAF